jgi:ubiquitin-conjugating enzyme E2 Q
VTESRYPQKVLVMDKRSPPAKSQIMSEEEEFGDENDDEEEVVVGGDDDDEIILDESLIPVPVAIPEPKDEEQEAMDALLGRFNPKTAAARRLLYDLRSVMKSDPKELGFETRPVGNDIFKWDVHLFGFEKGTPMYKDMVRYKKLTGRTYVEMQVWFPPDYPDQPPFVRVVQPRFQFHTGRVTIGGSLCTDVLTMESWNPAYDIQALILNIFSEICAGKPRIDFDQATPYSLQEAHQAFLRVARDHNWRVPTWTPFA